MIMGTRTPPVVQRDKTQNSFTVYDLSRSEDVDTKPLSEEDSVYSELATLFVTTEVKGPAVIQN